MSPVAWLKLAISALAVLVVMACGGGVEPVLGQEVEPVRVVGDTPAPTATRLPRLTPPTVTPSPTETPFPTIAVELVVQPVVAEDLVQGKYQEQEPANCVEAYQRRLIEVSVYKFHPEVLWEIYQDLAEERGDCGPAQPSFSVVCNVGVAVGGVDVTGSLMENWGQVRSRRIGPTAKDGRGNMLVHFEDLPGRSSPGCWYYSADGLSWSWRAAGGENGVFGAALMSCDGRLRVELEALMDASPAMVAGAVERVWEWRGECHPDAWKAYPSVRGSGMCAVVQPGGGMVIMWQDERRPNDGARCWIYDEVQGAWAESY